MSIFGKALRFVSKPLALALKDQIIGSFSTTDTGALSEWLQRNGYYRLAGWGGKSSYSGKVINVDTALESAAVLACVKIIAEDIGSLPFFTYRKSKDRKQVDVAYDHPLYPILHDLPNPETSAGEFQEALTAHALILGNGYAKIERNDGGKGNVSALYQLMPQDVRTDRIKRTNAVVYIHKPGSGEQEKTYPRQEIFHLRGFTLNGTQGDEILTRARHILGLTLSAQEYAARFFGQDIMLGVLLKFPPGVPELGPDAVKAVKERFAEWRKRDLWHEPAVLQGGMEAARLETNLAEMQLVEQRRFQILEVCRLFRMPPHKLAELDRATHSNAEQENIQYISMTLAPWIRRWRQAVHRCLLTQDEQMDGLIFAEHAIAALLRGDFKTQSEGFARLLEKGVWSINEVRRLLNQNPVEGGDEHFIQLNMQSVVQAASGEGQQISGPKLYGIGKEA